MSEKKLKIAYFIGTFPKLSESWFIEQLTNFLDNFPEAEVDIFSFRRGDRKDISQKILDYNLLGKTTYLDFPDNLFKRYFLAFCFLFKILFCSPKTLLKLFDFKKYGKQIFSFKFIFWTAPLINKLEQYDLVHCHFGMIANRYLMIQDFLKIKKPWLVTFYGQDSSKYIQQKGSNVYDRLKQEAQKILVMTEEMKERFVKMNFPPAKLKVHYTGVQPAYYQAHYQPFTPDKDIFRIISVGRFVEKKGFDDLLEAAALVVKDYHKLEINIVGGGSEDYEKYLKSLASSLGLKAKVIFRGFVPHYETLQLFSQMNLMVQLSKTAADGDTDDLPFVILEAQMSGLPVISTAHVGIPDGILNDQTGYLVQEGAYQEAAEKILYLINQPDKLKQFSAEAVNFIKEKFNLNKLNQELFNLYKSIVEK